ncbi:MAG: hypothetical protein AAFR77_00645 [Cyanobacteria bacterium J06631_2]
MFLNLFDQAIKNPFNNKARAEHDAKPKSSFFKDESDKISDSSNRDGEITFYQAGRLGEALVEALEKSDYPKKLNKNLINFVLKLGKDARLFPDMDTVDIWYTDYYDLIQCAEKLGLGDPRLPHWPEEPNVHYKYLELSKNELINMFLSVMNAILDRQETSNFSSLSIDWDNEIKKFSNKPTEIKQDNNSLPLGL